MIQFGRQTLCLTATIQHYGMCANVVDNTSLSVLIIGTSLCLEGAIALSFNINVV